MVVLIDQIADLTDFLQEGAPSIKALTGFDRVISIRFGAVGSGESWRQC